MPPLARAHHDQAGRILLAMCESPQSYVHLPHVLKASGRPVDAVLCQGHACARSRALSRVTLAGRGPADWAAAVGERLLSGDHALLVVGDESGLRALLAHPPPPAVWPLLPVRPGSELARTVGHKAEFYGWCWRHGLPVPETGVLGGPAEVIAKAEEMDWSCFVKGDTGLGGSSVHRIRCEADARRLAQSLSPAARWMLQRAEPGNVGCATFFAAEGRLLMWHAARALVCRRRGVGPMVAGEPWIDARVADLCERVAAASGLTGPGGFDFVESAGGELKLIDSHLGRCVSLYHFARDDGACLGTAIGRWLEGRAVRQEPRQDGGRFVKFPELIGMLHEGRLREIWPLWRAGARMPLAPPGDASMMWRLTGRMLIAQARMAAGAWRRRMQAAVVAGWARGHSRAGRSRTVTPVMDPA
jgi:hypothetical protein